MQRFCLRIPPDSRLSGCDNACRVATCTRATAALTIWARPVLPSSPCNSRYIAHLVAHGTFARQENFEEKLMKADPKDKLSFCFDTTGESAKMPALCYRGSKVVTINDTPTDTKYRFACATHGNGHGFSDLAYFEA